jgi:energy-coupling factor transporter ATP-binding protein EcfA2
MSIIEVKNLSYLYPDGTKALNNINFDVKKGDMVSLLGNNGAGKSTLISCLTGALRKDQGSINYSFEDGRDKIDHHTLDKLGVVGSDYGFPAHFSGNTVNRVMKKGYTNWDSQKFFELLQTLDLDHKLKTKKYSTGIFASNICSIIKENREIKTVASQYFRYATEHFPNAKVYGIEGCAEPLVSLGIVDSVIDTWQTGKTASQYDLSIRNIIGETCFSFYINNVCDKRTYEIIKSFYSWQQLENAIFEIL